MIYTGYDKLTLTEKELADFYRLGPEQFLSSLNLYNNEYVLLYDANSNDPVEYVKYQNGNYVRVKFPVIDSDMTGKIKPRNPEQYIAMDLLHDRSVPIKLITGKFGTGKTFLSTGAALEAVDRGEFDKIVCVRNNIQVKDTMDLGAIPGDANDKMLPFIMPFADHCGGVEGLRMLMSRGVFEVIPLNYLRGRSIRHSILYAMESENFTKQHIQLIMGRIDEGSELWLDGDIRQRDKNIFDTSQGLEIMVERLTDEPDFGYVHLVKTERSHVAALADKLDD